MKKYLISKNLLQTKNAILENWKIGKTIIRNNGECSTKRKKKNAPPRKPKATGPGKKRKQPSAPKERHFEEEGVSYETEPVKKEETDFLSQVLRDLRPARRRKKIDPLENQELKDMAQYFIKKMEKAAQKDIDLNLKGEPAINKLKMLPEVVAQVSKVGMQQVLMGYGLLRAISFWLKPLPDKSLPNTHLRTKIYKLLNVLYIDESALNNSAGLGKEIMSLWKSPKEIAKNKIFLQKLIEKWSRPIYGLSLNWRTLKDEEENLVGGMKKRKNSLGYIPYHRYAKKQGRTRASIPCTTAFDYGVRPPNNLGDDESRKIQQGLKGRKKRIAKTMENIERATLLMDHQFFAKLIDVSGRSIDVGVLES